MQWFPLVLLGLADKTAGIVPMVSKCFAQKASSSVDTILCPASHGDVQTNLWEGLSLAN